ncbi:acyl-homoserine-lactone synthase [Rouxiella sp. WC2420]|uniref:Acyl-homoserine-lactone synthase n=1 Tax=Rouxiella sp. WC2420 TaxID=3234145 RepID=A0AB39VX02_9GAMM
MLEFTDVKYEDLSSEQSNEIYTVRKAVFKDRLDWKVNCSEGKEFDQYDNSKTTYIFGRQNQSLICSLRFIETRHPTMIMNTFLPYFKNIHIPDGNFLESSRFFIDKDRLKQSTVCNEPVCLMLFLAKINYAQSRGYEGIYAIVSHSMLKIVKMSGWKIDVVERGISEKTAAVYLIFMPTDKLNQQILINNIQQQSWLRSDTLDSWPLSFHPKEQWSNKM